MHAFPLASPDMPRVTPSVFTPHDRPVDRPRSSPGATPLRHKQLLNAGGVELNKVMVLHGGHARPHRLVFDATHLMGSDVTGRLGRPSGDSPGDKENSLAREKLPALAPRFMAPKPPTSPPRARRPARATLYTHIVMCDPADGAAPGDRRVNVRHDKVDPLPLRPAGDGSALASPPLRRHRSQMSPLPHKALGTPTPTKTPAPYVDSPLTPDCA